MASKAMSMMVGVFCFHSDRDMHNLCFLLVTPSMFIRKNFRAKYFAVFFISAVDRD